jgi:hypothetical protein
MLTALADDFLTAAQDLGEALQTAQASSPAPAEAFGNSGGAGAAYTEFEATTEQTGVTVERLAAVLEGDIDRLYQVAFAYQEKDEESARSFPIPTHGPS